MRTDTETDNQISLSRMFDPLWLMSVTAQLTDNPIEFLDRVGVYFPNTLPQ